MWEINLKASTGNIFVYWWINNALLKVTCWSTASNLTTAKRTYRFVNGTVDDQNNIAIIIEIAQNGYNSVQVKKSDSHLKKGLVLVTIINNYS